MNTTVHWAYRGQVLSLISNLQYHTDPGKKKFLKSEHVHFLNIFEPNLTMWGGGVRAPRSFADQLCNPIQTMGADYTRHTTDSPPQAALSDSNCYLHL